MHSVIGKEEAVFAVVCDGMGGLQKGEVASAQVIQSCETWFEQTFPRFIVNGMLDSERLQKSWLSLIQEQDQIISQYGMKIGCDLGTTMVCILLFGGYYYVANIGDSRAYLLSDQTYQLTHDHSVVQMKIDQGLITPAAAKTDPQRNVLLQCIGASDYVKPDFFAGDVKPGQCFLLCCDGFRHVVEPTEIYQMLCAQAFGKKMNENTIKQQLYRMTETIKARGETDNISALLIGTM